MSSDVDEYISALKKLKTPFGAKATPIEAENFDEFSRKHNISKFQHKSLSEIVGHEVSEGEIRDFNKDTENTGYTLPGTKYEGPGNSVNLGEATTHSDRVAQIHDTQYFDANWRYGHGEISRKIYEQEIAQSDKQAIKEFNQGGTIGDDLGKDGLTIKHWTEKLTGQIYPNPGKYAYQLEKC